MNSKVKRQQKSQGFTLVELLVALFVFSLISAFAYRAVNTLVKTGDAIELEMVELTRVQRAMQTLERDLRQKSVQVLASTESTAVELTPDKTQLDLTLLAHSSGTNKQSLKHIRYSLKNHSLIRETWRDNKELTTSPDDSSALLTKVKALEIAALDQAATTTTTPWPAYFQVKLEHENLGLITKIVYFGIKQTDIDFSSLNAEQKPPP
ncbi:type II secretion system protein J [uncultured Thiothrix sp.]|uniref:PulJ/GspJ family protein n=1 Tax=uncultured Thiothrix sp. TaxID=223185 RepID=UPI0026098C41|nr:prepilin-type N-terminal cleavage/methylation domain-containing protein [uncultured Thiothrix sp.]HMT92584.1 prepilin-type N-terminal cleavage/methylation domain-containing protein [Thiolinea sp.]